jgi:sphinganine-1-phosphate aldolase
MERLFHKKGMNWEEIEKTLNSYRKDDVDWKRGRVPLYAFYADDDLSEIAKKSYMMFFTENSLGHRAFPSVAKIESEVISMVAQILNGESGVAGNMTSGGTESIFMAVKAARDWARKLRPEITAPELVLPRTAHPAFNKAAHYLCIKVKRVRESSNFRADIPAMEVAISDNTIMIVGSAPSYPHGVIDPIDEIAKLASKRNIWFHVDACVGGCLAPFVKKLGYPVPDFDFSIPAVTSISVDLHKYGFTPKPASTILYRNEDYQKYQSFTFDEWPGGVYKTQTFQGTRPSGSVAAAWAVMKYLGESGYLEIANKIMNIRKALIYGIKAIHDLKIWGDPDLSIIGFGSDTIDIHAVGDNMATKGWFAARNVEPPALKHMLMPVHEVMIDDYLRDLNESVKKVCGEKVVAKKSEVIY